MESLATIDTKYEFMVGLEKRFFTQPIFAEWFYLSICIKAAMYYEYFKRLPTMINEVKDSMKNYNEFLYINWTTIMIIKWSQSLQFRIIKMESENGSND